MPKLDSLPQNYFEIAAKMVIERGRLAMVTKALAEAVDSAMFKPGSEVSMYFKRGEDLLTSVRAIQDICGPKLDMDLSKKTTQETNTLSFEFKNGSVILIKTE